MKQYKRWLVIFGGSFLAAAVLVMLLTAYIDPFFQYHAPLEDFPYVVDHQVNQNPGMARHMEYDSVILGSSMTVNFNTNWFGELMGLKTLKLSYSGAFQKTRRILWISCFRTGAKWMRFFWGSM